MSVVSIHAPTRGATTDSGCARIRRKSFRSTPPREGRLFHRLALFYWPLVSIHAPTRGATFIPVLLSVDFAVSIHAPTRGATLATPRKARFPSGFDPRPHARGDFLTASHAAKPSLFRSTPPREGRPRRLHLPECRSSFDPRPHARGDTLRPAFTTKRKSFDPRPHARGDHIWRME